MHYYLKRLLQLGPRGTAHSIASRTQKKLFALKWHKKARAHNANHSWSQINRKQSFTSFFTHRTHNDFVTTIRQHPDFKNRISKNYLNKTYIFERANKACNNCLTVLGTHVNTIDWHHNFTPAKQIFFREIKPSPKHDIKIPWELSRFQHVYFLGKAYELSHDEKYAHTFVTHVSDWIEKNPFLLGVNWVCPMEVALRAINWIWGFSFFKHSKTISLEFWETFVCSLYDHMVYLENNWETSDKPNNHYISDLVGHLYLCSFFSHSPNKTIKKLLEQFDKQVQPDGTSYEGSTAYHKLVTELFWHMALVCNTQDINLSKHFHEKLNKMFTFLDAVSVNENEMVHIGDDDSGKVMGGIRNMPFETLFGTRENAFLRAPQGNEKQDTYPDTLNGSYSEKNKKKLKTTNPPVSLRNVEEPEEAWNTKTDVSRHVSKGQKCLHRFPNFGLTIIKNKNWHITYRHPTFNPKQPTGHFHHDQLAITLAIDGIPILVDPGSYLYTSNPTARNLFRSVKNHNTFYYAHDSEKFPVLFQLKRHAQEDTAKITHENEFVSIENWYKQLHRRLTFDDKTHTLTLTDWHTKPHKQTLCWHLIFHPDITVISCQKNVWEIVHNKKRIAHIHTKNNFVEVEGFFSPGYGIKERCVKLAARHTLIPDSPVTIKITKIIN